MQDEARKAPGLDLILAVWRRRKWLAIVVFAVPLSAMLPLVGFLPKIYESTATVVVERQQVPETFVRSTVTSELETRLQAISQEVLSRARLESLIARFGLYSELRKKVLQEEIIERMRGDIKLELTASDVPSGARRPGQTTIAAFTIGYRGSDPSTVALVTNTLASFYVDENLKARERQATGTADFMKFQLEETKKRLDEQERRVSDFKKRHIGELPTQLQSNLATLERLNTQLRINAENQIRTGERRDVMAKNLAEADPYSPAEGPDAASTRLARLKQELTALAARFTDRYPDVVRMKGEIAALERQLNEPKPDARPDGESRVPVSPQVVRLRQALNDLESETKALKAEDKNIRSAIAVHQQRVENTPRREQELQELSRDYETIRTVYASLLTRAEEAQLAESMEQRQKGEQFRILDPAIPSTAPVAPKRSQLLLVSLMVSLGLAAGAVLLAEQLDTSFHTVDDLAGATSVPVRASIPRILTAADAGQRRRRFRVAVSAAALGLIVIGSTSYLVAHGNEQLVSMLLPNRPNAPSRH